MQRIWLRAFIPAVFIAGVALVLFAYAAIIQQLADAIGDLCDEKSSVIPRFSDLVGYLHGAAAPKQVAASCRGAGIARITFGGVVVVVCAILGVLHWWARPLLGAQD